MRARWAMLAAGLACILAGAAVAAQGVISQKGKAFAPDAVDAAAGSAIQIENDDDVAHNITVTGPDGVSRNMGVQKPGVPVTVSLEKAGDYWVRCGIHPKMKLVVHAH